MTLKNLGYQYFEYPYGYPYPYGPSPAVCPGCGRCNTCGHGGQKSPPAAQWQQGVNSGVPGSQSSNIGSSENPAQMMGNTTLGHPGA